MKPSERIVQLLKKSKSKTETVSPAELVIAIINYLDEEHAKQQKDGKHDETTKN